MSGPPAKKPVLHTYPNNMNVVKIKIVAEIVGQEIISPTSFKMGEDNKSKDFLKMNPMGKVPVLEIPGKGAIFESNAIAWYLAALDRSKGLLGQNEFQEAQVKQWMDFTSNELLPPTITWLAPIMGFRDYDDAAHKQAVASIKNIFSTLNTVFSKRTYLVADRMTLADITLCSSLVPLYQMVIEPRFRTPYNCLNRYFETVVNNPSFSAVKVANQSSWCVVAQQPKVKKAAPKPAAEEKPAEEATPAEEKPKEEEKAKGEDLEDAAEAEKKEKKKNPLDELPKSSFILDEYKRTYSNTKNYDEVMQYLSDNFDPEGYSMYWCDYKYNADLSKVFMSANLIGGWFQRMDRMHKYGFGIVLITGEEKTGTKITGWWIIRGSQLPEIMTSVDDVELYEWKKIDFNDETKPRIKAFMAWDNIDGQEVQDGKCFK